MYAVDRTHKGTDLKNNLVYCLESSDANKKEIKGCEHLHISSHVHQKAKRAIKGDDSDLFIHPVFPHPL